MPNSVCWTHMPISPAYFRVGQVCFRYMHESFVSFLPMSLTSNMCSLCHMSYSSFFAFIRSTNRPRFHSRVHSPCTDAFSRAELSFFLVVIVLAPDTDSSVFSSCLLSFRCVFFFCSSLLLLISSCFLVFSLMFPLTYAATTHKTNRSTQSHASEIAPLSLAPSSPNQCHWLSNWPMK